MSLPAEEQSVVRTATAKAVRCATSANEAAVTPINTHASLRRSSERSKPWPLLGVLRLGVARLCFVTPDEVVIVLCATGQDALQWLYGVLALPFGARRTLSARPQQPSAANVAGV